MIIKAPYNFVPLSEKVYFPSWAKYISHDIPFEDGISGTIDLTITAESPVFVRNGHVAKTQEELNKEPFSNIENKYFIPGTSIKGVIRNVLEIMSFSKLKLDKNAKFAQREWNNKYLYPLKNLQGSLNCGWLKRVGNNYKLVDCGKPYRIAHKKLDDYFEKKIFEKNFSKNYGIPLKKEVKLSNAMFDPKTAAYKYELTKEYNLDDIYFEIDNDYANEYQERRVKVSGNGDINGTIVLTGQPVPWVDPRPTKLVSDAGKFYEFVFQNPDKDSVGYDITEDEFNHFKFIYSDSADWKYVSKDLDGKGIPVFFRTERDKNKKIRIKDFGLAYLYKLPYDNSPYDLLSAEHRDEEKFDLAECIFGYNEKKCSLKGRVIFSPAFSDNASLDKEVKLSLGSPKASYYPIYIEQDGRSGLTNAYKTYNDGKLRGWKRYSIKNKVVSNSVDNEKIDSVLHPVKKGSIFKGKIYFHNLKEIELGALLSAITFHNSKGCYHQIGQGKPLGLGNVKVDIKCDKSYTDYDELELMAKFEEEMNNYFGNWINQPQIEQLFTMSHEVVKEDDLFRYMKMDTKSDNNEFIKAKEFNEYLQSYSALVKSKFVPKSIFFDYKAKIERKKALIEIEKNRIEEERIAHEKEEAKRIEEEAKRIEEQTQKDKKEKLKEGGLSFLNEKNDNDEYKIKDDKGMIKRVDQWQKKLNLTSVPEKEHEDLYNCSFRLYNSVKNKRDWENYSKSFVWRAMMRYVGEEKSQKWYDDIVK